MGELLLAELNESPSGLDCQTIWAFNLHAVRTDRKFRTLVLPFFNLL